MTVSNSGVTPDPAAQSRANTNPATGAPLTPAQRWTKALRSGDYPQARAFLHNQDGYCCLGVACALFADELGLKVEVVPREDGHVTVYNNCQFALPTAVRQHLGLRTSVGEFIVGGTSHAEVDDLALRNDSGYLFDEIADLIDSRPTDMFEPR